MTRVKRGVDDGVMRRRKKRKKGEGEGRGGRSKERQRTSFFRRQKSAQGKRDGLGLVVGFSEKSHKTH